MNESFEQYLRKNDVDDDTLLEAFRTYVARQSDYLPPEEMQEEMTGAVKDVGEMDQLLATLADDVDSLRSAAHLILGAAWEDPEQRASVEQAIAGAKQKLPVIELGILAVVTMYAMYLVTTGGVRKVTRTEIKADGSAVEETVEFEPPTAPLRMIAELFQAGVD
jgi:hypothetical protein